MGYNQKKVKVMYRKLRYIKVCKVSRRKHEQERYKDRKRIQGVKRRDKDPSDQCTDRHRYSSINCNYHFFFFLKCLGNFLDDFSSIVNCLEREKTMFHNIFLLIYFVLPELMTGQSCYKTPARVSLPKIYSGSEPKAITRLMQFWRCLDTPLLKEIMF